MASVDEISAMMEVLSIPEKLELIERLASSIRRGGNTKARSLTLEGSTAYTISSNKPRRTAALGTLAWSAYVNHLKRTQPGAFSGLTKESNKLVIVKSIRAKDPEGYERFVENWKASHRNSGAAGGGSERKTRKSRK